MRPFHKRDPIAYPSLLQKEQEQVLYGSHELCTSIIMYYVEPRTTPAQPRFFDAVKEDGAVNNDVLKQHLQTILRPRLNRDVPVIDFVKAVFKFSPDQIPSRPDNNPYRLPRPHCHRFCDVTLERDSYEPLQDICADLKNQLYPNTDDLPLESNMFRLRDTKVEGNFAVFKPDFYLSTYMPGTEGWKRQQWSNGLAVGEVKRSGRLSKRFNSMSPSINLEHFSNVRRCVLTLSRVAQNSLIRDF